jgi:hypothetical protein
MRQRRNPVHRASASNQARALATFALGLTRQDEYGSVAASKTQLADRMTNLILEDLLRRGAEGYQRSGRSWRCWSPWSA